jgi:hypothetical protein
MRPVAVVLYVLALIAVVVGVDILFFRNHFWARADSECGELSCYSRGSI